MGIGRLGAGVRNGQVWFAPGPGKRWRPDMMDAKITEQESEGLTPLAVERIASPEKRKKERALVVRARERIRQLLAPLDGGWCGARMKSQSD